MSTLDLLGNGLTLFVGPEWNGAVSNGHGPSPTVSVERLDAIAAHALGLTTGGSLLASPTGTRSRFEANAISKRFCR